MKVSPMMQKMGRYALTMSAIELLSQYPHLFIPLINYMCFKLSSRSFKIKLTITVGIKERPIPTMKAKSIALPACSLCLKT
jgi:hypothetical protein